MTQSCACSVTQPPQSRGGCRGNESRSGGHVFGVILLGAALRALLVAAAVAASVWPSIAMAHSDSPPDIHFWGGFDPQTAACQRKVSTAVWRCFHRVLTLERACMEAQLSGAPCDTAAQATQIMAAKQMAQDDLAAACTDAQAQSLHFVNLAEAQTDAARACGDQAAAMISVVYGPALATATPADLDARAKECMRRTTEVGSRVIERAQRLGSQALDRMAVLNLPPSRKDALLTQLISRIALATQHGTNLMQQQCPPFDAVYGRDMSSCVGLLEPRASCLVSFAYVQNAVTCPRPSCGNGVQESGEQCDDGNDVDTDRCHNDCTLNTSP